MSLAEPTPGDLVERFSWEVEARQRTEADTAEYDQLRSDFLSERDRRARERKRDIERIEERFSATRSDDAIIFNKAKAQLLVSMRKFQSFVTGARGNEVPTCWDDVMSAAAEAQSQWETTGKESRIGRVKGWVQKMCNGLNNHATALQMLPSQSEYVSIIAGAVTLIIKASANYINISESFAKGMIEINDAVGLENLSHVYDTPVIQQLAMRLYAQIFIYLIKFMTWFTDRSRTRLLKSFNENSLSAFEEELAQVKLISNLLSRQIQLHMSADVHVSKLMLEDLSADISYLLKFSEAGQRESRVRDAVNVELLRDVFRSQLEKTKEEMKECLLGVMGEYNETMRTAISGGGMMDLLEQQASLSMIAASQISAADADCDHNSRLEHIRARLPRNSGNNSPEPLSAPYIDIRFESRHFEDYFTWEHVHPHLETAAPLFADATFVGRLNLFTTTTESQLLYAHGQYHPQAMDILQKSASVYASLARNAGVPVVSYFCELSHDEPPANRTRESVELSAVPYAMIRQLINILPAQSHDEDVDLSTSRFSTLDGTLRTWREALLLFKDLVRCVRLPALIFVIHGINLLEDYVEHSTSKGLESLGPGISCQT
ncbi:uncharacterized protein DNG_06861 [Cephalotrichum gorgonifer]|uniref:DUF7708 domain-containing protein n=1 Tax=Cephalotrichum gorgonifer TaxID=2041049 RepID=A0AAE8N392_9PEZI|nr:uncharacterized protein DNG_06861 [Cephalotrichum gorgonifer]